MDKVAAVLILWAFWQLGIAPLLFGGKWDGYPKRIMDGIRGTIGVGLASACVIAVVWAAQVLTA